MKIDAHAHTDNIQALGSFDPPEKVISLMDTAGIDKAVVSTYCDTPGRFEGKLEFLYDATKKYSDRLLPYIRLNPKYGEQALDVLDKAVKNYGFMGVKLHPVGYVGHPCGDDTIRILNRAADYDIPVLFHCSDEAMSYPLQIGEAAKRCPQTKIILGHMGGFYHVDDAIRVCKRNKNVYMDTSETPYVNKIKQAINEIGAHRILFGTDLPTDNPIVEIEKIKSLKLAKEEEDMIFYKNIAGILKLKLS